MVALEDAKRITGLRAVFGEVYPDPVRVIAVGQPVDTLLAAPDKDDWLAHSIEFCGGERARRGAVSRARGGAAAEYAAVVVVQARTSATRRRRRASW